MADQVFRNRTEAGRALARVLAGFADRPDVIVLALPRGGVPVAFEVAEALHLPLDVFIVRKLGVPGREEYAMGALASGGEQVINEKVLRLLDIPQHAVDAVIESEQRELERRERLYRDGRAPIDVRGRTVILVDDGLATGSTMFAAVKALRRQQPAHVAVAVPAAAADTSEALKKEADAVICVAMPEPFRAVGLWYEDFSQTSDEEVCELLARARRDASDTLQGGRP